MVDKNKILTIEAPYPGSENGSLDTVTYTRRNEGDVGRDILAVKIALGLIAPSPDDPSASPGLWFSCDTGEAISARDGATFDKKMKLALMKFQLENQLLILLYLWEKYAVRSMTQVRAEYDPVLVRAGDEYAEVQPGDPDIPIGSPNRLGAMDANSVRRLQTEGREGDYREGRERQGDTVTPEMAYNTNLAREMEAITRLFESEFGSLHEATLKVLHGWMPHSEFTNDSYLISSSFQPAPILVRNGIPVLGLIASVINEIDGEEFNYTLSDQTYSVAVPNELYYLYRNQLSIAPGDGFRIRAPGYIHSLYDPESEEFRSDDRFRASWTMSGEGVPAPGIVRFRQLDEENQSALYFGTSEMLKNIQRFDQQTLDVHSELEKKRLLERAFEPDYKLDPDPFEINLTKIGFFNRTNYTFQNLPRLNSSQPEAQAEYQSMIRRLEDEALKKVLDFYGKKDIWFLNRQNENFRRTYYPSIEVPENLEIVIREPRELTETDRLLHTGEYASINNWVLTTNSILRKQSVDPSAAKHFSLLEGYNQNEPPLIQFIQFREPSLRPGDVYRAYFEINKTKLDLIIDGVDIDDNQELDDPEEANATPEEKLENLETMLEALECLDGSDLSDEQARRIYDQYRAYATKRKREIARELRTATLSVYENQENQNSITIEGNLGPFGDINFSDDKFTGLDALDVLGDLGGAVGVGSPFAANGPTYNEGDSLSITRKNLQLGIKDAAKHLRKGAGDVSSSTLMLKGKEYKLDLNEEAAKLEMFLDTLDTFIKVKAKSKYPNHADYLDLGVKKEPNSSLRGFNDLFSGTGDIDFEFEPVREGDLITGLRITSISLPEPGVVMNKKDLQSMGLNDLSPMNRPRTVAYVQQIKSMGGLTAGSMFDPLKSGCADTFASKPGLEYALRYTYPQLSVRPKDPLDYQIKEWLSSNVKDPAESWWEESKRNNEDRDGFFGKNPGYSTSDVLPMIGPACTLEDIYKLILDKFNLFDLLCDYLKCLRLPGFSLKLPSFKLPAIPKLPTFGWMQYLVKFITDTLLQIIQRALCSFVQGLLDLLQFPFCEDELANNLFGAASTTNPIIKKALADAMTDLGVPKEKLSDTSGLIDDVSRFLTPRELCALLQGQAVRREVYAVIINVLQRPKYANVREYLDTDEKIRFFFEGIGFFGDSTICEDLSQYDAILGEYTCKTTTDLLKSLRDKMERGDPHPDGSGRLGATEEEIEKALAEAEKNLMDQARAIEHMTSTSGPAGLLPDVIKFGDKNAIISKLPDHMASAAAQMSTSIFDAAKMSYISALQQYGPNMYLNTSTIAEPGDANYDPISRMIFERAIQNLQNYMRYRPNLPDASSDVGNINSCAYWVIFLEEMYRGSTLPPFDPSAAAERVPSITYQTSEISPGTFVHNRAGGRAIDPTTGNVHRLLRTSNNPDHEVVYGNPPSADGFFERGALNRNRAAAAMNAFNSRQSDNLLFLCESVRFLKPIGKIIETENNQIVFKAGTETNSVSSYREMRTVLNYLKPDNDDSDAIRDTKQDLRKIVRSSIQLKMIERIRDLSSTINANLESVLKTTRKSELLKPLRDIFRDSQERHREGLMLADGARDPSPLEGNVDDPVLREQTRFGDSNSIRRDKFSYVFQPFPRRLNAEINQWVGTPEKDAYTVKVQDYFNFGENPTDIFIYRACDDIPEQYKDTILELSRERNIDNSTHVKREVFAEHYIQKIREMLSHYNFRDDSVLNHRFRDYLVDNIYGRIYEGVSEQVFYDLSDSDIFEQEYNTDLARRVAGKSTIDEIRGCIQNKYSLSHEGILAFEKMVTDDFPQELEKELGRPENAPELLDYSTPGPVEKAVQNTAVKGFIRISLIEMMLKGAIVYPHYNFRIMIQENFFRSYAKHFVERSMAHRRSFTSNREQLDKTLQRIGNIRNTQLALEKIVNIELMKLADLSDKIFLTNPEDGYMDTVVREEAFPSTKVSKTYIPIWGGVRDPRNREDAMFPQRAARAAAEDLGGYWLLPESLRRREQYGPDTEPFVYFEHYCRVEGALANPHNFSTQNLQNIRNLFDSLNARQRIACTFGQRVEQAPNPHLPPNNGGYDLDITPPEPMADERLTEEVLHPEELDNILRKLTTPSSEHERLRADVEGRIFSPSNQACHMRPKVINRTPTRLIKRDRAHITVSQEDIISSKSDFVKAIFSSLPRSGPGSPYPDFHLRGDSSVNEEFLVALFGRRGGNFTKEETRYYSIPSNGCVLLTSGISESGPNQKGKSDLIDFQSAQRSGYEAAGFNFTRKPYEWLNITSTPGTDSPSCKLGHTRAIDFSSPNIHIYSDDPNTTTRHLVNAGWRPQGEPDLWNESKTNFALLRHTKWIESSNDVTPQLEYGSWNPYDDHPVFADWGTDHSRMIRIPYTPVYQDDGSVIKYHPFDPSAPWFTESAVALYQCSERERQGPDRGSGEAQNGMFWSRGETIYRNEIGLLRDSDQFERLLLRHTTPGTRENMRDHRNNPFSEASQPGGHEHWIETVIDLVGDASILFDNPGESFDPAYARINPGAYEEEEENLATWTAGAHRKAYGSLEDFELYPTAQTFISMGASGYNSPTPCRPMGYNAWGPGSLRDSPPRAFFRGDFEGEEYPFWSESRKMGPLPDFYRTNDSTYFRDRCNPSDIANNPESEIYLNRVNFETSVLAGGSRAKVTNYKGERIQQNEYKIPIRILLTQIKGIENRTKECYVRIILPEMLDFDKRGSIHRRARRFEETINTIFQEYRGDISRAWRYLRQEGLLSEEELANSEESETEKYNLVKQKVSKFPVFTKKAWTWSQNHFDRQWSNPSHPGYCSTSKIYSRACLLEAQNREGTFRADRRSIDQQFLDPGFLMKDNRIIADTLGANWQYEEASRVYGLEDNPEEAQWQEAMRRTRSIFSRSFAGSQSVKQHYVANKYYSANFLYDVDVWNPDGRVITNVSNPLKSIEVSKTIISLNNIIRWYQQRRGESFWGMTSSRSWLRGHEAVSPPNDRPDPLSEEESSFQDYPESYRSQMPDWITNLSGRWIPAGHFTNPDLPRPRRADAVVSALRASQMRIENPGLLCGSSPFFADGRMDIYEADRNVHAQSLIVLKNSLRKIIELHEGKYNLGRTDGSEESERMMWTPDDFRAFDEEYPEISFADIFGSIEQFHAAHAASGSDIEGFMETIRDGFLDTAFNEGADASRTREKLQELQTHVENYFKSKVDFRKDICLREFMNYHKYLQLHLLSRAPFERAFDAVVESRRMISEDMVEDERLNSVGPSRNFNDGRFYPLDSLVHYSNIVVGGVYSSTRFGSSYDRIGRSGLFDPDEDRGRGRILDAERVAREAQYYEDFYGPSNVSGRQQTALLYAPGVESADYYRQIHERDRSTPILDNEMWVDYEWNRAPDDTYRRQRTRALPGDPIQDILSDMGFEGSFMGPELRMIQEMVLNESKVKPFLNIQFSKNIEGGAEEWFQRNGKQAIIDRIGLYLDGRSKIDKSFASNIDATKYEEEVTLTLRDTDVFPWYHNGFEDENANLINPEAFDILSQKEEKSDTIWSYLFYRRYVNFLLRTTSPDFSDLSNRYEEWETVNKDETEIYYPPISEFHSDEFGFPMAAGQKTYVDFDYFRMRQVSGFNPSYYSMGTLTTLGLIQLARDSGTASRRGARVQRRRQNWRGSERDDLLTRDAESGNYLPDPENPGNFEGTIETIMDPEKLYLDHNGGIVSSEFGSYIRQIHHSGRTPGVRAAGHGPSWGGLGNQDLPLLNIDSFNKYRLRHSGEYYMSPSSHRSQGANLQRWQYENNDVDRTTDILSSTQCQRARTRYSNSVYLAHNNIHRITSDQEYLNNYYFIDRTWENLYTINRTVDYIRNITEPQWSTAINQSAIAPVLRGMASVIDQETGIVVDLWESSQVYQECRLIFASPLAGLEEDTPAAGFSTMQDVSNDRQISSLLAPAGQQRFENNISVEERSYVMGSNEANRHYFCNPLVTTRKRVEMGACGYSYDNFLEHFTRSEPGLISDMINGISSRDATGNVLETSNEFGLIFEYIFPIRRIQALNAAYSTGILGGYGDMYSLFTAPKSALSSIFEIASNRNDFGDGLSNIGADNLTNSELFNQMSQAASSEGVKVECLDIPGLPKDFWEQLIDMIKNFVKYFPSHVLRGIADVLEPGYKEVKHHYMACNMENFSFYDGPIIQWISEGYTDFQKKELYLGMTAKNQLTPGRGRNWKSVHHRRSAEKGNALYTSATLTFPVDLIASTGKLFSSGFTDWDPIGFTLDKFITYIYSGNLPFLDPSISFAIPCLDIDEKFGWDKFQFGARGRYGHPLGPIALLAFSTLNLPADEDQKKANCQSDPEAMEICPIE